MPNLKLFRTEQHPYQPSTTCAYIYYKDSKNQPVDSQGNQIDTFYNDPHKLRQFLHENILPKIQEKLSKKHVLLKAVDVDFMNQAPHPFISIQHPVLCGHTYIEKVLNAVISDINREEQKKLKTNKSKESKTENDTHYSLRHKK